MELRDYQKKAIEGLRAAYRAGKKAPLLCLPTGGGKTVIFSYIAQSAAAKGKRVLILVHRRELVQQTSETLASLGLDHGIIAAGHPMDTKPVQVASVQTLVRRLQKVNDKPDLIIIDEAHHAVAGSWAKILDCMSAASLLGVTATPMRLDGRGLKDFFDLLTMGPSIKELTECGYLARAKCFSIPVKLDRSAIHVSGGEFQVGDAANIMQRTKINGNAVAEYKKHCAGKPAVVFCCTIAHSVMVAEMFRDAGFKAAELSHDLPHELRKQRIEDLGKGKLHVLTSCNVISEGTDIPAVAAAILLRPTQSEALYLQQVGRALRPAPGKEYAVIIDCVGNVHTHGLPDADRVFTLEGKDEQEKAPGVRECPKCYALMPAGTPQCPECGYIFAAKPIKEVVIQHVDLVEVKTASAANRKDRRRRIAMARTFEQLEALRVEFGYKPGWTYLIMRERIPKQRKPVATRGQDWSALLAKANIPESPGYEQAAKMVGND